MGKRLYVGNLPYNADEAMLKEAFGQDGRAVANVHVVMDRETGRPRGFAFVEMATDADAQKALAAMDGAEFAGRNLRVSEAEDRRGPAPGPRPGGGGFSGPRSDGPPRSGPPRTGGAVGGAPSGGGSSGGGSSGGGSSGGGSSGGGSSGGGSSGGGPSGGGGFSRPKPGWSDPPAEPKKYENKKTPRRRHEEPDDGHGRRGGRRFSDDDDE